MDKEHLAIQRLRDASLMAQRAGMGPLYVLTSGGKDSSVLVELTRRAGVPIEVAHSHTTADAPETVYFVRDEFRRLEGLGTPCTVNQPAYKGRPVSMWTLIPQKLMPPTRLVRYCCDVLKEAHGQGRMIVTGVRWAESAKRKSTRGIYEVQSRDPARKIILNNDNDQARRAFETCTAKGRRVCNPIVDWTDADVWDYIRSERIPVNPLYGCGFRRVGCVGCPMAGKSRVKEFARYPRYEDAYIRAFDAMLEARKQAGKEAALWQTGRDVFHWWMEDGVLPGQMEMEDFLDDAENTLYQPYQRGQLQLREGDSGNET